MKSAAIVVNPISGSAGKQRALDAFKAALEAGGCSVRLRPTSSRGEGAEIVDVLKPQPGDIVIEGKRGLCGFASTNLDFILRSRGIDTIALGGFLTNCCVESTMRTAYEKGYDVITLTDCTAATRSEEQQAAVSQDYPMFSQPMTSEQVVGALQGAGAVGDASRRY